MQKLQINSTSKFTLRILKKNMTTKAQLWVKGQTIILCSNLFVIPSAANISTGCFCLILFEGQGVRARGFSCFGAVYRGVLTVCGWPFKMALWLGLGLARVFSIGWHGQYRELGLGLLITFLQGHHNTDAATPFSQSKKSVYLGAK